MTVYSELSELKSLSRRIVVTSKLKWYTYLLVNAMSSRTGVMEREMERKMGRKPMSY